MTTWQEQFDQHASGVYPAPDDYIEMVRRLARDGQPLATTEALLGIADLFGRLAYVQADVMVEHQLRCDATDRLRAVQAKLSDAGVSQDDIDVRAWRQQLDAAADCAEEATQRWCENELADALGVMSHDGWDALIAAARAQKAECERLRADLYAAVDSMQRHRP